MRRSLYRMVFGVCAAAVLLVGIFSQRPAPAQGQGQAEREWAEFKFADLLAKQKAAKRAYLPFLNVPTLNTGLYVLPKDGVDNQNPHRQDEVYYVVGGKGRIQVGSGDEAEDLEVQPGSIVFVKAGVEHRFHDITEELQLLVFFSTAESR